jgi:fumarate hydratase subunit beta
MVKHVELPLTEETLVGLRAGDDVRLSGVLYVARDAAHQRIVAALEQGKPVPFDIRGQTIYYMGPSPARPGRATGSAGPTTSKRMDSFSPRLLAAGLRGMVGKGVRSQAVKDAMKKYRAVYLAATGGVGALLAKTVTHSRIIAYRELGTEAVRRLEVRDFPVTVINDIYGGDLYEEGRAKYRKNAPQGVDREAPPGL